MFTMALSLTTGILSAVAAPRLGHLSDRYGRTKLLALSSCGGCASELIFILCAKFPDVFHYNWLILAATCDGLTGSFTAGQILSNSYTSDCTPPSRRAVYFGRVHACLFLGLAVGPLLASYLVALTGSLLSVFYVTLGCHLFFVTFVGLVVPESLSRERQQIARKAHDEVRAAAAAHAAALHAAAASSSSSSPSSFHARAASAWATIRTTAASANVLSPLKALWPTQSGSSPALRRNLVSFAIVDTILLGAGFSVGTVLLLYCESENTWNWKTPESSRFISAVSFVRVFVLLMLLPAINYVFRTRPAARRALETGRPVTDQNAGADAVDVSLIRVALLSDLIGSLGYLLARRESLFVASGLLTAVGGLGSATVQSAATKHVPAEQVGKLLGAVGLLQALSRVVGPIAFNSLYYATVGVFDQAIFALLVGLFGVAFVTTMFIRPHVYLKEPAAGESEEEPLIRRAE
ncbi:major facilitator superfamily domain-containing protein [Plectosphaerella cucumerina]|uniref:Major facilitator superfamily domain-containing protein n=1 Tax=Plectosphaerella cucumerina TaxID=40658 RepID=A0A8K0WYD7_9PEZI|nr:major facilitator superfamily domain-containing protein [Plectosphaerella cucumerina]